MRSIGDKMFNFLIDVWRKLMDRKPMTIVKVCVVPELESVIASMDSESYVIKQVIEGKDNNYIVIGELNNFLEEYRNMNEKLITFMRLYADMYMKKDRNPVLADQVTVYRAALLVMKECGMSVFKYTDFSDYENQVVTDRVLLEKLSK